MLLLALAVQFFVVFDPFHFMWAQAVPFVATAMALYLGLRLAAAAVWWIVTFLDKRGGIGEFCTRLSSPTLYALPLPPQQTLWLLLPCRLVLQCTSRQSVSPHLPSLYTPPQRNHTKPSFAARILFKAPLQQYLGSTAWVLFSRVWREAVKQEVALVAQTAVRLVALAAAMRLLYVAGALLCCRCSSSTLYARRAPTAD